MTPELLNKLKHLANMAAHLPHDVTLEDEDAAMKALHDELAADTVLQMIALAERTTAPVTIPDTSQDWAKLDGAQAFHLIERHADGWAETGNMMESWLAARMAAAPAPIQQATRGMEDPIMIPRGLVEAACHVIRKNMPHSMLLEKLRAYTVGGYGEISQSPPALAGSQVQAAGGAPMSSEDWIRELYGDGEAGAGEG